jgi:hypothetical protein
MKNPRQPWLIRGIDGFGLKLEAHPQIRRGARQQQAQQTTGLGKNAIGLMVTGMAGGVKRGWVSGAEAHLILRSLRHD